ncbi:hypothetical protein FVQ98_13560 [Ottowia sp. GY511]|uniref:Uncharacterized protein n=1 Tax=Ottowia flava TaxID=2675430 RepID=A0ABW4KVM6_9BURK|nr:hypothetical protein [Ottowia sp. GY511]TXK26651.1 hypothetical protein FVQ98_13560 [Ottowia sp. GY511]
MTVSETVSTIQTRTRDDGFLGTSRNGNLKDTVQDLKNLSPAERGEALSMFTDDDLKEIANDVNAGGIFGASGLSNDEKRDLFDTMADGASGKDLAHLASAFDSREDTQLLAESVASKGSNEAKQAYIQEMSARTADNDSGFSSQFLSGSTTDNSDKDAKAVLTVLNSFDTATPEGRAAFDQAIKDMPQDALKSVAKAGVNETTFTAIDYSGGANGSPGVAHTTVSYRTDGLNALLDKVAGSSDPQVKGKVFEAAADAVSGMRENAGVHLGMSSIGTDQKIADVVGRMTTVMNSDPRGITDQLNKSDAYGLGLSTYVAEVMRSDPKAGAEILGKQLAQLQGAGTGLSPTEFFEQQSPGTNGTPYYKNAETLGYYAGALRAGIDSLNKDTTETGTMVKGVLGAAISAASLGRAGGTVSGLTGAVVDQVVAQANGSRTETARVLEQLAIPVDANGDRYQGPATATFDSKAAKVRAQ